MTSDARIFVDTQRGPKFTESPRRHDGQWWFLDIHGQAIRCVDAQGQQRASLRILER